MTFERFYSIIMPHKAASFNTIKKAWIIIIGVIILSILFHIPHLFISDSNGRFCVANRISAVNVFGAIYYWLSLVVSFAFPFVSLLIMNSFIIHTLRQRSKMGLTRSDNQGQNEGQNTKGMSSETQIFIVLLLVTFAFLILTTPAYVLIFYMSYYHGNTPQFHAGYHFLHHFGEKTYFTNNGINFFLYVMSGQKFRNDLVKLFKCGSLKRTDNPRSFLSSSFKTKDSSISVTDNNSRKTNWSNSGIKLEQFFIMHRDNVMKHFFIMDFLTHFSLPCRAYKYQSNEKYFFWHEGFHFQLTVNII